jgi:hypothetical protein
MKRDMCTTRRRFLEKSLGASTLALARPAAGRAQPAPGGTVATMATALRSLSSSLPPERRSALHFPFADDERSEWFFVPRPRKGVPLGDLDETGRQNAHALLRAGLGASGYEKVTTIISLENVLRELEGGSERRDPRRYYVRSFGEPGAREPWGWSFEGHHVSLNYTVVGARLATTPAFLGANPAQVRHGERKGLRVLGAEEDLARALLASLDSEQRKLAVVSEQAPSDILTSNVRKAVPQSPAGLAASRLSGQQLEALMRLVREYAETMPAPVAESRMAAVRGGGTAAIHFAWAGGAAVGQGHYYRVQGPGFLLEYDNTQNDANHVHSVWRDFDGDFGADLLAEHHQAAHRHA